MVEKVAGTDRQAADRFGNEMEYAVRRYAPSAEHRRLALEDWVR